MHAALAMKKLFFQVDLTHAQGQGVNLSVGESYTKNKNPASSLLCTLELHAHVFLSSLDRTTQLQCAFPPKVQTLVSGSMRSTYLHRM